MQQDHRFTIGADVRRSDVGIHANRRFAAHMPRLPGSRDHDVAFAALGVAAGGRGSNGGFSDTHALGHTRGFFDAHAIVGPPAGGAEGFPRNPPSILAPPFFSPALSPAHL